MNKQWHLDDDGLPRFLFVGNGSVYHAPKKNAKHLETICGIDSSIFDVRWALSRESFLGMRPCKRCFDRQIKTLARLRKRVSDDDESKS